MILSNKRFVTILGHRFKRRTFFRWLAACMVFISVICASWIALVALKSSQRQQGNASQEQATATSAATRDPATSLPHSVAHFIESHRKEAGFHEVEALEIEGTLTDSTGTRTFIAIWRPGHLHEKHVNKDGEEIILIHDGRNAWRLKDDDRELINNLECGQLLALRAQLIDPFASLPGGPRDYRQLFDEDFSGMRCAVFSYRLPGSFEARLFFERKTQQEVRRLLWIENTNKGQREVIFQNHAKLGPVILPGLIDTYADGQRIMRVSLTSANATTELATLDNGTTNAIAIR